MYIYAHTHAHTQTHTHTHRVRQDDISRQFNQKSISLTHIHTHTCTHTREHTQSHTNNQTHTQGVAVCCSVLQCVAVCCSVLQCVAAHNPQTIKHTHRVQHGGQPQTIQSKKYLSSPLHELSLVALNGIYVFHMCIRHVFHNALYICHMCFFSCGSSVCVLYAALSQRCRVLLRRYRIFLLRYKVLLRIFSPRTVAGRAEQHVSYHI